MRYLSICSGIEAASVAWESLGWEAAGFSEIEPFACAVLHARYPKVKNFGDFTKIEAQDVGSIDLIIGGTPCQDFSTTGLKIGLDGKRGQLTLEFVRLVERIKPHWIVWENVTGVLSNDKGRALGAFLGALAQCGYGFAYRVLDAQYFGVPQRRRRIFVIGHCRGDWRRAAAVLFENKSMQRENVSSRDELVLSSEGSTGRTAQSIGEKASKEMIVGYYENTKGQNYQATIMETLTKSGRGGGASHSQACIVQDGYARMLMPKECERLQGFPDDYTLIMYKGLLATDGPRYAALGNSMAVPVMRWIGERIQMVDSIPNKEAA